jgi:hypothetical protein
MVDAFYSVRERSAFTAAMQQVLNQLGTGGVFVGDNLFTFGKNLSFLHDTKFMEAFDVPSRNAQESGAIWRVHTLCWAAQRSLRIAGDFVECACYRGTSARTVANYVEFGRTDKHYWLYDLFEHDESTKNLEMAAHGADLYAAVRARFADLPNVTVTQGRVPDVLEEVSPQQIAFLHLDLNNADAEIGALEILFDRVSPGGIIVLDDYGWLCYQAQKTVEDAFFAARGCSVLELPTGQGLVIK